MRNIDLESHEALRVLLADLIAEPIGKSIDEKTAPELKRVIGQLGALANKQSDLGKDIKSVYDELEEGFHKIHSNINSVQQRLSDHEIGSELQQITVMLGALEGKVIAIHDLQSEVAAKELKVASADRLGLVLAGLSSLKKLAAAILLVSIVGLACVASLLVH